MPRVKRLIEGRAPACFSQLFAETSQLTWAAGGRNPSQHHDEAQRGTSAWQRMSSSMLASMRLDFRVLDDLLLLFDIGLDIVVEVS